MCGLAGWTLKDTPTKEERKGLAKILETLCEAAAMRGTDSHGVAQILFDGALMTYRGLGSIEKVVYRIPLGASIMLHTRAKTVGSVNVRNAHPFSIEGILGAHNGVVSNHRPLESEDKRRYTVDSQALLARIGQGKDAADVDAWGAVTWINEEKPNEGIYLAQLPAGSLEIAGGQLSEGTPINLWASVLPNKKLENLISGYKEYDVKRQQVYVSHGGIVYETHRKLAVGKNPKRSYASYYSKSQDYTQGPNGEKFKASEPCKCSHPFSDHSVFVKYGGICKLQACSCKEYEPAIGVEAANQATKVASVSNQRQETKSERQARILASPDCEEDKCKHPRIKHKKGKGICWEKGCPCRKYVLKATPQPEPKIESATSTVYEVPKHPPLSAMCSCGHQNMAHMHTSKYHMGNLVSVDRSCMGVRCECESFTLADSKPPKGAFGHAEKEGSGSAQTTFPERDTLPTTGNTGGAAKQLATEGPGVADVGATLAKLGEEAAQNKKNLTDPCHADICKGNGKCLSTVCPSRRTKIAPVIPIHSGYDPNREKN